MKRKALKLLSMILTAAMVLSCSILIAFAEEAPKPKVPELKTALADSISLITEDGFEYAIRAKDDAGTDIWKWADTDQYDAKNHTVTFKSLTADTEYTFARRAADAEDVADTDIQTYKTAPAPATEESAAPPASEETKPEETKPVETVPEETKPADTVPEETKPADTVPEETKPADTVPEKTKPADTVPKETKPADTVPEETKPADTVPEETKPADTVPEETKPADTVPEETKPADTVPEETKPADTVPEETKPADTVPEETKPADTVPEETKPADKPEKAPTPGKPVLVSVTDTEIVVSLASDADKAFGYEFTLDGKTFTAEPSFKDLKPDTDYEIKVRIKAGVYDGKEYMESDLSEALKVHTMKAAAPAPKSPVLESRTETSLKVKTEAGQEYALKGTDKWQTSGEFNNLQANTAYEIVTRTIYDPDQAMESLVSEPLKVKTVIGFSWHIGGVEDGKTYDAGTSFKADVSAAGLDNTSPTIGDTRYRPLRWNWGGDENGYFKDGIYNTEFRITDSGNYRLNVVFGLETFTEKGWISEGREETASVSFKIVAKEFTIKATSTVGGKLSPTGTLTVLQAKNYTIKMIPDKDYKLAKLLVDGKEVNVKDLKYTFENVNSNHTIHAVFEKAGKLDAPKTGDETPLPLYIAIAAVSLLVIIGAAVFVVKRNAKK